MPATNLTAMMHRFTIRLTAAYRPRGWGWRDRLKYQEIGKSRRGAPSALFWTKESSLLGQAYRRSPILEDLKPGMFLALSVPGAFGFTA
jgi:hypothetical protein